MSLFLATCGPTAIGKTTQMQRLLRAYPQTFTTVLSVTTREQRDADDALWYRFISRAEADRIEVEDILTKNEFRGELYFTLRSEVEAANVRKPIAFMAIRTNILLRMRELHIPHSVLCCRVGDEGVYRKRLALRGYAGDELERQCKEGMEFEYPKKVEGWPQVDVLLGSDEEDDSRFDFAVSQLAPTLFDASESL